MAVRAPIFGTISALFRNAERSAWYGRRAVASGGRRLLLDDEAGAAIEFALLAPAFIALLLAITNTLLIYLAQEALETAAESAARLLLTGQAQTFQSYSGSTQNTGMTAAQFTNAICGTLTYSASANASTQTTYGSGSLLPPLLSCSNLYVNVAPASSFANASTAPVQLSVNGSGNIVGTSFSTSNGSVTQNQILVVQLLYLWPTVTGPLGLNMGNTSANNRILTATEVIDTETYPCPTGQTTC
jgi:Flp pilus assembly protein TadG